MADPELPAEPPVPVEPPAPVEPPPAAPVVAAVPRTAPAAKAARPGAGPWPIDVVPDVLPRVEIAIEPAPLDLPSVVRPAPVEAADVPVALLRTLDEPAPESAQAEAAPESDPVELRWRPDAREPEPVAYPEPASAPAEPVVLGAPEPVEPAEPSEPVVMATPVPSAELRVDHAAKSVESAKRGKPEREPEPDDRGSRHAGGDEVGEQVISDAEVVILPAGER